MTEKRFTWEYSNYDYTGEIHDWIGDRVLITDYLQKWELEEWCQELNKIVDENKELKREIKKFKELWAETLMENAELKEKIDKSNKRFVKNLNTISKTMGLMRND